MFIRIDLCGSSNSVGCGGGGGGDVNAPRIIRTSSEQPERENRLRAARRDVACVLLAQPLFVHHQLAVLPLLARLQGVLFNLREAPPQLRICRVAAPHRMHAI